MKFLSFFLLSLPLFLSTSAQAESWDNVYWVYCGKIQPDNYITWYWRESSIKKDRKSLQRICRERGQSTKIVYECSKEKCGRG